MSLPRLGGPLVFTAVLLTPLLARAEKHDVCLYLNFDGQYWDASPSRVVNGVTYNDEFREEFGRNEGDTSYPAQRWLVQIVDNEGGVLYGWAPLDGDGCATVDIATPSKAHVIQWVRWAHWENSGNHLVGYDCESDMETCNLTEPINRFFTPGGSDSTDVIINYTSTPDPTDDPELPRDMVMWATSFAEERMNGLGENPLTNTRMYPLYDEAGVTMGTGVVPGDDNATHYVVGNQPGFNIQASGYQHKFTIAHEYGHINTLNALSYVTEADVNYCYDENTYPSVMNPCPGGPGGHALESAEWNAVAASEGVATWYSVATWHDVDIDPPSTDGPNWTTADTNVDDQGNHNSFRVPRAIDLSRCNHTDFIPALNCPVGVANEWDWTSLFQVLRRDTGMSLKKTFQLLAIVHSSGNWIPDGPNNDFFDEVDLVAQQIFTSSEYQVWQTAAVNWEVDQ